MSENAMLSATGSRFGWPKPARLAEFQQLRKAERLPTTRVVFQERSQDIPIIRVPIELPKYRLSNGRTVSLQVEHLAKNPQLRRDLFTGDAELWDAQETQHKLLLQLGRQSDLSQYFESTANTQVQPLLLDENGFVVNGNRRLSTWRQLLADDSEKYGHFRHIDVAVLPHCTEREIERLEATLQVERDIRADYNWDALANMLDAKIQEGMSVQELAELYGMKRAEIQELLDARDYAVDYLFLRGKKDLWSEVSGNEHAFRRIVQNRSKVTGLAKQEVFKEAAFALIDDPSSVGRLYEAIPALAAHIEQVSKALAQEFPLENPPLADDLEELFGGGLNEPGLGVEGGLVAVLQQPERMVRAREVIANVLEAQRQLKKDTKTAGYLLDTCAKANGLLAAAVKDGLRPETKRAGVELQLKEIESHVVKIKAFLAEHA